MTKSNSSMPEQLPKDDMSLSLNEVYVDEVDDDASMRSGVPPLQRQGSDRLERSLARNETTAVRALRLVIVLVLVAAAALVSAGVYLYTKHDEEDAFEEQFNDLAERLVEGFHANAQLRLQVLDQLAISATSFITATGQTWPMVTFGNFEARARASLSMVGANSVGFSPVVTKDTRAEWEAYTANHTYPWVMNDLAYQEYLNKSFIQTLSTAVGGERTRFLQEDSVVAPQEVESTAEETGPQLEAMFNDETDGLAHNIYRFATPEQRVEFKTFFMVEYDLEGPYVPIWQDSPVAPTNINTAGYNLLDPYNPGQIREAILATMAEQKAVFAGVWNVQQDGTINMDDDYDFREVPAASIIYPVFDQIMGEKEVAGILYLDLEFGPYFSRVLPPNANGIVCVMSTSCGQAYSYLINGGVATYLGTEKQYDDKYETMRVSASMNDFTRSGSPYYGAPVKEDFCPWTLEVYPTQDLEDDYVTSKPIYYTLAVLGVFLFSCFMFFLYDRLQEKRQRVVMTTAVKSDKIVSELFPSEFKGQLYQAKKETDFKEKSNFLAAANHNKSLMADSTIDASGSAVQPPPMAQSYPNCTVFFGDIAGFTAWSSSRSPADVFFLLETLYGAFDKLAKKHRVFKIETIGDCYVSVTGLPLAQDNHAWLMVKFARECLSSMSKLTRQLEGQLGPDTGELALRVGIHSGPVTAGVLRGEKARFQLFGDTVNTAARMESNGIQHRIHASRETADELVALGRGAWVHAREDKIHAKGKGELQTYLIYAEGGHNESLYTTSNSDESDILTGEDNELLDVESVIARLPGTNEAKLEWSRQNFKRISWAAELLTEALDAVVAERASFCKDGLNMTTNTNYWQVGKILDTLEDTWDSNSIAQLCVVPPTSASSPGLDPNAIRQLEEFVTTIAYFSKDAPFRNFEFACHTLMSTHKMLIHLKTTSKQTFQWSASATFAVMVSTLIRNLVPNEVMSSKACKKAIRAAVDILNGDRFDVLRVSISVDEKELQRFWQWVYAFMSLSPDSTDSFSAGWAQRWEDVFSRDNREQASDSMSSLSNRRTLAVLEHIVLLSKSPHAFQHWDNFVKWNRRHYKEVCDEYEKRPASRNPLNAWYVQQLLFFDQFAIPLAEKIDLAAILGVVGSEMKNYAQQNRREWESSGRELVQDFASDMETTVEV